MKGYDVKIEDEDLVVLDNDFVIVESDQQHIQDTCNAFPGWWKENPADGVGMLSYLGSSGKEQELQQKIKLQLQSDGYQVMNPVVEITNESIIVNTNAERI